MKCRVCKCSEYEPCNPPCAWAAPELCTTCAAIVSLLREYREAALRFSRAALMRELDRPEPARRNVRSGNARELFEAGRKLIQSRAGGAR